MLIEAIQSLKSKLHRTLNNEDNRAKIQDADFVCCLLQAIAQARGNFSLNTLRLAVCTSVGCMINSSTFNGRIATASLVENIKVALNALLSASATNQTETSKAIAAKLGVSGVVGIDGSLVSLWDGLKDYFGGTFTTASVKLHLAVDLITGGISWYDLTPGATHDSQRFPDIYRGFLYIFDLGYWSVQLLKSIDEAGGFFLSRLKAGTTVTVTQSVFGWNSQSLIGRDLLSFPIFNRRGKIVELMAVISTKNIELELRVIGFWNQKSRQYHWYITNLTAPRGLIYDLYRVRWQIELCFKSMKSILNFDRIPSLSPNAVLSLSLLTLCNFVMTSLVRSEADLHNPFSAQNSVTPSIQKATNVFRELAGQIYSLARLGTRITQKKAAILNKHLLLLTREVFDPNFRKRKTSLGVLSHA